ncbi:MAG: arabinofuranosyltransferase [Actinomycetes bacterium]
MGIPGERADGLPGIGSEQDGSRPHSRASANREAPSRARRGFPADGPAALLTWLVATPLAVLLVRRLDLDPFSAAGAVMPVGVGCVAGAVLVALLLRRHSDLLIGAGAGLYAAWVGLTLATALHGTPFGYGLMVGDAGRFAAMAMKYMSTERAVDMFVRGLPTEYPPLYPWIVGHVARLVDRPAWQLFGEMQIFTMSASVVLAYLLWRRLVGAPVAFTIVALAPAVFAEASKDYEFVTLLVILPWLLATFAGLPRDRGGLHWLPAGLIGGLIVLTYPGWVAYAALGVLVLIFLTWRAAASRRGYVLHLLGVAATAFVVSSWYVVPFVVTLATDGGSRISDLWTPMVIVDHPLALPFLALTPVGVIELAGLFGMVWYRRTTWWAQPLLLVLLSAYAYRVIFLLRTVLDDHNGYLQYTDRLIGMLLATAGVLTVFEAAPALSRRLSVPPARGRTVAVTAAAVLVAWAAVQGWQQWVPGPRGLRDASTPAGGTNLATAAHTERLPDGRLTRFAVPRYEQPTFPTSEVERVIQSQLGAAARPVVLSYDQRLFSFVPFYGYLGPNRLSANTLQRWDDRAAEVHRLAGITDPATFARASRETRFGAIDAFVLRDAGGRWTWNGVSFSPAVFDSRFFHVETVTPKTVVAVHRR